jgi:hypothetical protein
LAEVVDGGRLRLGEDWTMPAFLVRTKDTCDLVGFFSADNEDDLIDLVDECTEPEYCEYLELPSGGVYWDSPAVAVPIGPSDDDETEEKITWNKADLTDFWAEAVYGISDGEWLEFYEDAPESPKPTRPSPRPMGGVVPLRKRK